MPFNIRNLIIFLAIGVALSSVYYFFIRSSEPASNLVTNSVASGVPGDTANVNTATQNELAQNFLSLLLNVKDINLNTDIFADRSFNSLIDSSIVITQDGSPGRPNPFAQFGADAIENPATSSAPANTTTPVPASTPANTPATGI